MRVHVDACGRVDINLDTFSGGENRDASIKQSSNAFGKLLLNVPDLTFIKISA
jgi:hypothetical protein